MIEYVEDLIPKRSIVRVKATKEEGIFLGNDSEYGILVIFYKRLVVPETQFFHADDLTYVGTPGTDCPYLDDFL